MKTPTKEQVDEAAQWISDSINGDSVVRQDHPLVTIFFAIRALRLLMDEPNIFIHPLNEARCLSGVAIGNYTLANTLRDTLLEKAGEVK